MKIGLKITAFVLSCFLVQSQSLSARSALTEADAKQELERTMKAAQSMLENAASHDFIRFCSLVDGGDTAVQDSNPLEAQTDLGKAPVIVVEEKNGNISVIASRRGSSEVGLTLTTDPVHQEIVKQLASGKDVAKVYYRDKTGASFEVLAWSIGKLQESQPAANRLQGRNIYAATEVEVIDIPTGEVDVNASKTGASVVSQKAEVSKNPPAVAGHAPAAHH